MNPDSESSSYDLLVAGTTPGGIAMAVRAARLGLSVLLTNYHSHPGGLLSSGLAVWDTLYEGHRSPIYDVARRTIMEHYRTTYGEDSQEYRDALPGPTGHTNGKFESKVAEKVFSDLIAAEKNITTLTPFYPESVERDGARIVSVTFREFHGTRTRRIRAAIFADCTYEGDLMALSGAPYALGRESRDEYDEPHAGRIFLANLPITAEPSDPVHAAAHARLNIRHMGGAQKILPAPGTGEGDGHVQAMNYRTSLSKDPANRLPVEKPANYDPEYCARLEYGSRVQPVPHNKMGWNRPQLVGLQTDYVEADWEGRQRILDAHWDATMQMLYYMQNDASLPDDQRVYWRQYGVARDEYIDNGHRPYEIYVREARRLKGRAVFTEHDGRLAAGIERTPIHADSIAATEWYFDTHACTLDRIEGSMDEGKMMLHQETMPGQISWRCLLSADLENLIVPSCVSCSHVAWGGIRLEPTWMNIAESTAFAAALARRENIPPSAITPDHLVRAAATGRIMITFFNDVDVAGPESWIPAVQYFGTKGFFPSYDARPAAPLTTAVATEWARIVREMSSPDFSPTDAARRVYAEESMNSPSISREDFLRLINRSATGEGSLTRAEACEILFTP